MVQGRTKAGTEGMRMMPIPSVPATRGLAGEYASTTRDCLAARLSLVCLLLLREDNLGQRTAVTLLRQGVVGVDDRGFAVLWVNGHLEEV